MIISIAVPGGRVLADETACLLDLGSWRHIVRTPDEYETARGAIVRQTWAGDREARLTALQDAWEYHKTQAGEALLRRAALAGTGVLVVRRGLKP